MTLIEVEVKVLGIRPGIGEEHSCNYFPSSLNSDTSIAVVSSIKLGLTIEFIVISICVEFVSPNILFM